MRPPADFSLVFCPRPNATGRLAYVFHPTTPQCSGNLSVAPNGHKSEEYNHAHRLSAAMAWDVSDATRFLIRSAIIYEDVKQVQGCGCTGIQTGNGLKVIVLVLLSKHCLMHFCSNNHKT